MKTIILGAFALAFAAPAAAQTGAAPDPHAGHQASTPQGQQHQHHAKHSMEEMHKHCMEMMKHHGKLDHGAKSGAAAAPAKGGHDGHQGH